MSDEFKDTYIVFNSQEIREIEELSVLKECDSLCMDFSARISYGWWLKNKGKLIRKFDLIDLFIGNIKHKILVDSVEIVFASAFSYTIKGRDIASLLVDSNVERETSFTQKTPSEIAQTLIKPFHLITFESGKEGVDTEHTVFPTDTVYESIIGASRKQGLHLINSFNGLLSFEKKLEQIGSIQYSPEKFISVNESDSASGLFSKYIYKGQSKGSSDIGFGGGDKASNFFETLSDDDVSSRVYKPKVLCGSSITDIDTVRKHLGWQRRTAKARARSISLALIGLKTDDGKTLDIWKTIKFRFDDLDLNDEFLISGIKISINKGSSTSIIEITGKDAYDVDPADKKRKIKEEQSSIGF